MNELNDAERVLQKILECGKTDEVYQTEGIGISDSMIANRFILPNISVRYAKKLASDYFEARGGAFMHG